MNSTDFSIAFLESLAEDMRALEAEKNRQPATASPIYSAVTFVSGLLALCGVRLMSA